MAKKILVGFFLFVCGVVCLHEHDLNKRKASIRSNQWQKCMDVNTKVFIKLNYKKRDVYV